MTTVIHAKLEFDRSDPENSHIIIRRTDVNDDGRFQAKYGLSVTGDWLPVKEGEDYPGECWLPVVWCGYVGEVNGDAGAVMGPGHNDLLSAGPAIEGGNTDA